MLPEPLTETESAGRDIRTCQLQSSNSSFRAGTSLAVSPPDMGFSGQQDVHPPGSPVDMEGRVCSAPWQGPANREQTHIPCTTPASSAEHALLEPSCHTARLKPSGNCSDESSHPKGSVTHPLPSSGHSLPCLCSLEQLCSPLPVPEHPAKLLAPAKPT